MVKSATDQTIDLAASSRRLEAARDIAGQQARFVEAAGSGVDRLNVDLLFLTQETVLVLDETHRMLAALSARYSAVDWDPTMDVVTTERPSKASSSRRMALAVQAIVLAIVAAFAIEVIDPAPMDVFAFDANLPVVGP